MGREWGYYVGVSVRCDLGREGVTMLGFLLGVTLLAQMQLYGGTLPCGGDQSHNPVTRSGML